MNFSQTYDASRMEREMEDIANAKPRTWGQNIGAAILMAARTQQAQEKRKCRAR